ncbi:Dynamin-3 [Manis pentadactyla]|nr:Dynamin-3 [Manis pentadactyla]
MPMLLSEVFPIPTACTLIKYSVHSNADTSFAPLPSSRSRTRGPFPGTEPPERHRRRADETPGGRGQPGPRSHVREQPASLPASRQSAEPLQTGASPPRARRSRPRSPSRRPPSPAPRGKPPAVSAPAPSEPADVARRDFRSRPRPRPIAEGSGPGPRPSRAVRGSRLRNYSSGLCADSGLRPLRDWEGRGPRGGPKGGAEGNRPLGRCDRRAAVCVWGCGALETPVPGNLRPAAHALQGALVPQRSAPPKPETWLGFGG